MAKSKTALIAEKVAEKSVGTDGFRASQKYRFMKNRKVHLLVIIVVLAAVASVVAFAPRGSHGQSRTKRTAAPIKTNGGEYVCVESRLKLAGGCAKLGA